MAYVCGMRLRTWGVLIGWMGSGISFVALILCSLALTNIDAIVEEIIKNNPDMDKASLSTVLTFMLFIYLAFLIINLVASSMLVAGTIKEKHLMLVPWLFNSGACLVFNIFYSISFLIKGFHAPEYTMIIFLLSSLVFHIFLWYLIYSLFRNIRSSSEQQHLLAPTSVASGYNGYTSINKDMREISA